MAGTSACRLFLTSFVFAVRAAASGTRGAEKSE
jgi:hypothetical protein